MSKEPNSPPTFARPPPPPPPGERGDQAGPDLLSPWGEREQLIFAAIQWALLDASSEEFDIAAGTSERAYARSMAAGRALLLASKAVGKAAKMIASAQANASHEAERRSVADER